MDLDLKLVDGYKKCRCDDVCGWWVMNGEGQGSGAKCTKVQRGPPKLHTYSRCRWGSSLEVRKSRVDDRY